MYHMKTMRILEGMKLISCMVLRHLSAWSNILFYAIRILLLNIDILSFAIKKVYLLVKNCVLIYLIFIVSWVIL